MLMTAVNFTGRALLAQLFILAGFLKLTSPKPFLDHMAEHRVPGALLPMVALFEIWSGVLILSGWQSRWAALAVAGFCVVTAFVFHLDWSIRAERTQFIKDIAIAGGMLVLASNNGRAWPFG